MSLESFQGNDTIGQLDVQLLVTVKPEGGFRGRGESLISDILVYCESSDVL